MLQYKKLIRMFALFSWAPLVACGGPPTDVEVNTTSQAQKAPLGVSALEMAYRLHTYVEIDWHADWHSDAFTFAWDEIPSSLSRSSSSQVMTGYSKAVSNGMIEVFREHAGSGWLEIEANAYVTSTPNFGDVASASAHWLYGFWSSQPSELMLEVSCAKSCSTSLVVLLNGEMVLWYHPEGYHRVRLPIEAKREITLEVMTMAEVSAEVSSMQEGRYFFTWQMAEPF